MFPGAAGGDSRGGVARGLAALTTGITRTAGVDHHHQIPAMTTTNPYLVGGGGNISNINLLQQRPPSGIQMPYTALQQQRQFGNAKRSYHDIERHQLQNLQADALVRSVRRRIGMTGVIPATMQGQQQQQFSSYLSFQNQQPNNQLNQLNLMQQNRQQRPQQQQHLLSPYQQLQQHQLFNQNHIFGSSSSPLSPADSSTATSVSGVTTNASSANFASSGNPSNRAHNHLQTGNNNTTAIHTHHQQLEFAKANGFFPCTATSSGSGCDAVSDLTQSRSDCGNRTQSSPTNALKYIEDCLLDDDDDDFFSFSEDAAAPIATGSEAAKGGGHSDWSGTMEDLLALTEPPQATQPESDSGSATSMILQELIGDMTGPPPSPQQQQAVSASASASTPVSVSTPASATPPPTSPLQLQDQQQQQQNNKSPLSPSTPSSSTCSSISSAAHPVSPAPQPVSPAIPTSQLLSEAAAAIADRNTDHASSLLAEVKKSLSANNNPAARASDLLEQRLQAYLADALLTRTNSSGQAEDASLQNQNLGLSPVPELCSPGHLCDVQRLHEVGLFYRMSVSLANMAILESALGLPKIHILDFDIGGGSQYAALMNSIYNKYRPQNPHPPSSGGGGVPPTPPPLPFIKITAVADPLNPYSANTSCPDRLAVAEAALARQAKNMGFGFEFTTVRLTPSELTRAAVGCASDDEPLIVNFGFVLSKLADESVTPQNPRDELLRRVKSLSPRLVTVMEQEMNCNTAPFLARFRESLSYYSTAFDALRAHSPPNADASVLAQAEAAMGRKVANSVAAEGWRRVERCEVLGKWRSRFGMAGFKSSLLGRAIVDPIRRLIVGLGDQQQKQQNGGNAGDQAQAQAQAVGVNNVSVNVSVEEEGGGVVFGWKGRRLTAVSAWRC